LVIIVTPRLATPADFSRAAQITTMGGPEPKTGDLIFKGQALDKPLARDAGVEK
jgi:Flp pilus assembly secretin CpaC